MILTLATQIVRINSSVVSRAAELIRVGYGAFDALHIAAAESVAVVLLTTDDRLVKRAARGSGSPRIVQNPVSWNKEE